MSLNFVVFGRPCAVQSVRFTRAGHKYQPAVVLNYRSKIQWYAQQARNGNGLMEGPLEVTITAYFMVARSWSKKRQLAAQWHTQRPDCDNLIKAVLDGLKGVLFQDDAQVSRIVLEKYWTRGVERLEVAIFPLMEQQKDGQKTPTPGGGPGGGSAFLSQQRCRS
jgi:Holliday junction resolvase RusA-like endonuclease